VPRLRMHGAISVLYPACLDGIHRDVLAFCKHLNIITLKVEMTYMKSIENKLCFIFFHNFCDKHITNYTSVEKEIRLNLSLTLCDLNENGSSMSFFYESPVSYSVKMFLAGLALF
jgi:hypothetical protein